VAVTPFLYQGISRAMKLRDPTPKFASVVKACGGKEMFVKSLIAFPIRLE